MTDLKTYQLNHWTITVHDLDVQNLNGEVLKYTKLEVPPVRVSTKRVLVGQLPDGVGLYRTEYGEVTGLPEPQEGVLYIVPAMVRNALPDRKDLASPGALIRNEQGQPVACDGLDVNF